MASKSDAFHSMASKSDAIPSVASKSDAIPLAGKLASEKVKILSKI